MAEVSPTSHPPRATATEVVVSLDAHRRKPTRGQTEIDAATARRAAAVAAHRATKEAN